jgi:hypothetical protein
MSQNKAKKKKCCGKKAKPFSTLPNRHEKLFTCGRIGKQFSMNALQMFYLLSILYLASYLIFNAMMAYKMYRNQD